MSIPIIGVTSSRLRNKAGQPYIMDMEAYIQSVSRAGGAPVIIPLGLPDEQLDAIYQTLDGILFTGGGDIAPEVYDGEPHPSIGGVDTDRDRVEFALIRRAAAEKLPFFGICRGIQAVNVASGGTLYSDISAQFPKALQHPHDPFTDRKLLPHTVEVEAGSSLATILGSRELPVNSLHHQGIQRLAEPLRVLAHAPDGLIEAVELTDHPFGLAVQWHPEWLQEQAPMRALFVALVEEGKEAMIGIFDSGVGGLSVLREIRALLPELPLIFLADQAHVPYGKHSLEDVRQFSEAVTRYLLDRGAQMIVVACNTASAAALHSLRQTFPDVPFVGMEPAIKPAAALTHSGIVGVLATRVTFDGPLYASVVERFAHGVTLLQNTCPGLVEQIEAGELTSPTTRAILEGALLPMLARDVDAIVLGCTHYPFVTPLIQEIVGPEVAIIDPAPAVARQVKRLFEQNGFAAHVGEDNGTIYMTTGDSDKLSALLPMLLGEKGVVEGIKVEG